MIRRFSWMMLVVAAVFFIAAGWYFYHENTVNTEVAAPQTNMQTSATGRYVAYQPGLIGDDRYEKSILFFAKIGSEESDAFDGEIAHSSIADATQVIRVDVDKYPSLVKKYDVTVPPTFVRVSYDGKQLAKWVGYGHTKSLQAVLENTK